MLKGLLQACNIIHHATTACHPQTNGITEHLSRTFADVRSILTILIGTRSFHLLGLYTTLAFEAPPDFLFLLFEWESSSTLNTILLYHPDATEHRFILDAASCAEMCGQLVRHRTTSQAIHNHATTFTIQKPATILET